ncbi:helix-turn-helix transcriptional regulator [Frankia sp. Cr1]|uniref:helix-turn-helix transcriptional regulator n=1 Tax=Frankia sp. Cr1 TaxID=3073931 RepID=UPI002AD371C2|nr:helix-turn-helix transcriptional regulator [Frankia sp. Cr1]
MTHPPADRRRLADGLQTLRFDAGMSTTALAGILGWSQSKVSKTELGRTMPTSADVEAWCVATRATADIRGDLVRLAEQAAHQAVEWRRELAPGRRRKQEDIQRLEAAASVVRVFSPDVVVGLAQIRAYAEAVFRLGRRVGPVAEPGEGVVEARLARQSVLADHRKQFQLLMGETALHRQLVPPRVLRLQLKHLAQLAVQANVVMGVIPFVGPERVHQYHGFAVLGEPGVDDEALVLAETVTRGVTVRSAEEVAEYVAHFEGLRRGAVEGDQLAALLQEQITRLGSH